jgi:hypothetical protein
MRYEPSEFCDWPLLLALLCQLGRQAGLLKTIQPYILDAWHKVDSPLVDAMTQLRKEHWIREHEHMNLRFRDTYPIPLPPMPSAWLWRPYHAPSFVWGQRTLWLHRRQLMLFPRGLAGWPVYCIENLDADVELQGWIQHMDRTREAFSVLRQDWLAELLLPFFRDCIDYSPKKRKHL